MIKQKANKNLVILDNSQYLFGNDGNIMNPESALNKKNITPLRSNADGIVKPPYGVGMNQNIKVSPSDLPIVERVGLTDAEKLFFKQSKRIEGGIKNLL